MNQVTLGRTGITVPQNGFGALPIQRVSFQEAADLLLRAYQGGMRFFDTAHVYSDSEEKIGFAFDGFCRTPRESMIIATKCKAKTVEEFWEQLNLSLERMRTDYIDIYQFHLAEHVIAPGDGSGLYEAMLEAKEQGKIRHIGVTAHKLQVAFNLVESGLYDTLQYPFSYLSSPREIELVKLCEERNVGFICMKGMAGGLITNSRAAMAFTAQFPGIVPIWGIQKPHELDEWLSYMDEMPVMDDEIRAFIDAEREALAENFCRGCGYCAPCPQGIVIDQCARMSLMLRRAPSQAWLNEHWQEEMAKTTTCTECRACTTRCPYELDIPELLKRNYADYQDVLAGKVSVG